MSIIRKLEYSISLTIQGSANGNNRSLYFGVPEDWVVLDKFEVAQLIQELQDLHDQMQEK